jgi:hypothetical protein
LGFPIERTTQKIVEKHAKTYFTTTWSLMLVVEVGDYFYHDFQTSHGREFGL